VPGGDGLVAARHLVLFGFRRVSVVCPVNRFPGLTTQLAAFCVPLVETVPQDVSFIVDCLFGFSFAGPPVRAPFDAIIRAINSLTSAALLSVDVPSGWPVDGPPTSSESAVRMPDALISLTAPKACSLYLRSSSLHYCGGRFVPPCLSTDLAFATPSYTGTNTILLLNPSPQT
jgi:NAD(P)H-hydrate epimerase